MMLKLLALDADQETLFCERGRNNDAACCRALNRVTRGAAGCGDERIAGDAHDVGTREMLRDDCEPVVRRAA